MRWRRLITGWMIAALAAAFLGLQAHAGTYYTNQDDPTTWWYAQEDPSFWLLVPSDAASYRDIDLFGVKGVDLVLREGGPQVRVRRVRGTDVDRIWAAERDAWSHSLRNGRLTTNRQITTANGVRAHFKVLEATASDGTAAMIRFVAFVQGDHTVYLVFLGPRSSYSGRAQDAWLKAVNSFSWR